MTGSEYEESFLTVAEVAELLKLNQQTVRNWIDAGTLPAVRIGRRVRIKRSDLDRILESGYQGSSPATATFSGPSATDFWSGEPVGAAELAPPKQTARKGPESGSATSGESASATSVDTASDDHS
jgi:excisionase family DNA binding protein